MNHLLQLGLAYAIASIWIIKAIWRCEETISFILTGHVCLQKEVIPRWSPKNILNERPFTIVKINNNNNISRLVGVALLILLVLANFAFKRKFHVNIVNIITTVTIIIITIIAGNRKIKVCIGKLQILTKSFGGFVCLFFENTREGRAAEAHTHNVSTQHESRSLVKGSRLPHAPSSLLLLPISPAGLVNSKLIRMQITLIRLI